MLNIVRVVVTGLNVPEVKIANLQKLREWLSRADRISTAWASVCLLVDLLVCSLSEYESRSCGEKPELI